MKNKLISAFAAIAMMAVSFTPIMAEWHPSQAQTGVDVPAGSKTVTTSSGKALTVTTGSVSEDDEAIVISTVSNTTDATTKAIYNKALQFSSKSTDAFLSEFGSLQTDVQAKLKEIAGSNAKSDDLEMLGMFDVHATEAAKAAIGEGGTVDITVSISGVKASGKYVAVHFTSESTAEVIPCTAGDGTVTFTMGQSYSPVMILSYTEGSSTSKSSSSKTANTSDESNVALYAGIMVAAVVAAGVVFFTTRKKVGQD